MSAEDEILQAKDSPEGMASLRPDEYEDVLMSLIAAWVGGARMAPLPVVACGMLGAKQGWQEMPYHAIPCAPLSGSHSQPIDTKNSNILVTIVAGLSQTSPADVMRGEETQVAGFLHRHPSFSGVVCLPGTHAKWVEITRDQKVGKFQTYMTGELFSLISKQSVLRHCVADNGMDESAFLSGVTESMQQPTAWLPALFHLRAASLLDGMLPGPAYSRLSGLLIGTELLASESYWGDQEVVLIGAEALSELYRLALQSSPRVAAKSITIVDSEAMTLAGLTAAYKQLKVNL